VTDYILFAWIADVIIDPQFRGQGIGKFLMQCVTGHPAIASTMQLLRTRNAHELYEQFDFQRTECMTRR
jgi:GNAT superfamily N-acetyltransferase